MPVGLGLASSHAPSMFAPLEDWKPIYDVLSGGVPAPPELADETNEVLKGYIKRIKHGFETLQKQLESYKPDALVIVGDDQNEVFGPAFNASLAIYLGEEVSGSTNIGFLGQPIDQNHVQLRCDPHIAQTLLNGLVEQGFDPAWMTELKPISRPKAGIGHAFSRTAKAVGAMAAGIPVIPVFLNAYFEPLPPATRCFELGKAIRTVFAHRPERIALYASGGLSHDPRGPRSGWVDEPLDNWVLARLAEGKTEELLTLFTFDSDTMRSGTGEIRSWIVAAAAFHDRPATVVDYIPARHAVTGLGFAYWSPD
jgi:Catalytic LigB subunit of aromatic ring-opening dioxygenase